MTTLERDFFVELTKWFNQPHRMPLLIRGARQVGKSFCVTEWGRRNNKKLLSINFEESPQIAEIFESDLNVRRIIDEITIIKGVSLKESDVILFFDEIQKCPKAITALRYFYEKVPELPVIAAGSLLEFVLEEEGIPVGRVESRFLYPLKFSEFLNAVGKSGLAKFLEEFSINNIQEIPPTIHGEFLKYLKLFYKIGGMPKVVSDYVATEDIAATSKRQALIIQSFKDDFLKYAKKTDWSLLDTVFNKMADIAGGSTVKFSSIDSAAKAEKVRRALKALQHAMVIHHIYPSISNKLPLSAGRRENRFKMVFLDIGLLHHLIGFDWSRVPQDADLTKLADGRFAEQFVAQEIIASRSDFSRYNLHFWERPKKGAQAEVDFLIELNNQVIPIEVKSGERGTLRSLDQYILENNPNQAFVLSQKNIAKLEDTLFLPLYLAGHLVSE
jgi:predicted AAA+ superfamily ATPase